MDLTTNYSLGKPLGTEDYDIGVQNANMDIIDTQLKARADGQTGLNTRVTTLEEKFTRDDGIVESTTNSWFDLAANWTQTYWAQAYFGPLTVISFTLTRATSAIPAQADGQIGNVDMMTWKASGVDQFKPRTGYPIGVAVGDSQCVFGAKLDFSKMILTNLAPGIDLAVGQSISGSFTYMRQMLA